MGARVIQLADYRARRSALNPELAVMDTTSELTDRFHFWSGASGQRYVHTVYDLIDCPEFPAANFLLVHREKSGRRTVLAIGHATHAAGSLNLAEIRQRGAELGADEVHVHLLADNSKLGKLIEFDLRTGQVEADIARLVGGRAH